MDRRGLHEGRQPHPREGIGADTYINHAHTVRLTSLGKREGEPWKCQAQGCATWQDLFGSLGFYIFPFSLIRF